MDGYMPQSKRVNLHTSSHRILLYVNYTSIKITSVGHLYVGLFLEVYSVPLIYMFIFLPIPCYLDLNYCSLSQLLQLYRSLKMEKYDFSNYSFKNHASYSFFAFPYTFRINLFLSTKNLVGILIGFVLNLKMSLRGGLTSLHYNFPIFECSMSSHLFRSSLIYFICLLLTLYILY